ncbi:unnamed protein product [Acanthoscelides obtectus]|uniref:Uncharacterized protein n=1 Tax=Acanthoscelides obtectus TaxID=200917 RepID=A0A9P0L1C4_ACAOB|nr:unnamed protein product [Acanthoscelides obtectus]CAK1619872.1 X-linked retinitis pigmentosa GTPase regulator homolog [Acanthoscelides obtectus]
MSLNAAQDIFELCPLIENIDIKLCARCENGVKQLLALVTSGGDLVLHYAYGELTPVLRRIPWLNDSQKTIQAICFDPSATWLLAVCIDSSLYIIPALSIVDKKQKVDCKWSLNDTTYFPKHPQVPDAKPTSIIWWQTFDCNQNALVGFENGNIVLISLTDGRCLGSCSIGEPVKLLCLCQDNSLETVSLLINAESGQQWKLVLEHHSSGYIWPPDANNQSDDSTRSRLYNLKQMGVDKLASLRQRFSDARGGRRDSQTSDTTSESSHSESNHSVHSGPELLPHLCDTFFAPQYARNRYLFSAFYKPTSLLTVHAVDVESAPLYVHKLPQRTSAILLTDRLIYTVNDDNTIISVLSAQLSECRLEGDAEFNNEALVAQFYMENDKRILQMFKLSDLSAIRLKKNRDDGKKDKLFELPKTVDDLNIQKPRIDTCVVVTQRSVYKISIRCSPIKTFVEYVTDENDLERAEKISLIFGLNIQQLLEGCGDLLISRGSYHSGIILYKQAKVHLLKRVLKLAVSADCKTLLKFVHLCLSASKVDMSIATKIHIGNLAVMAYTELILRYGGQQRVSNTKDFMNFLCYEEYYDQILAVNVACQAGHWNVVSLLATTRGLQPEVVSAMGQILQSARAPKPTDREFVYALSEPSLSQSLLILGQCSQVIFQYIRTHVAAFPVEILYRLAAQLDPSQPCAVPLVSRMFHSNKHSSSLDTTIEMLELDNPDRSNVTVRDMIETFLTVAVYLTWKTEKTSYDSSLLDLVHPPDSPSPEHSAKVPIPDLRPLSCGFEHAAVIRNDVAYAMGVSAAGCLGLGPMLTQSSPPQPVRALAEAGVRVLSVSCGRKHTLALTDYGVYAWGSNAYGQLGLGSHVQESPYPQMLTSITAIKMIDVVAGQYHSLALSSAGQVYTWGWGIHGQLGQGNCDNLFYPKLLNLPFTVKQIAAGHAHSLILTTEGKLYGFGSNVFGQLESCHLDANKSAEPVWVVVMPDMYMPIEKIATAYFHNIAVRTDQEVFTWGASPQEVRLFQSKNNQRQNGVSCNPSDSWKSTVHIYSGSKNSRIDQVAVGYRHSAILQSGKILWGKNRDEELCQPTLRQQDNMNSIFMQRFKYVSCGLDYTMAIDHTGKLLAWGSPSMAQTILGKQMDDDNRKMEAKVAFFKNTKRVVRFPASSQSNTNSLPIEVPGLPTMAITFNPTNHKLLFSRNFIPYAVRLIENSSPTFQAGKSGSFDHIYDVPKVKYGHKTLHYALETYYGFYDTDTILSKCLEVHNYQAAAKMAILGGHFGDSLGFQLIAFKKYMETLDLNLRVKRSKNMREDMNEKNLMSEKIPCQSPAHILSSSSSLDSIRQWGEEEHQGGCESPCEVPEIGDIRQNVSQYVQSLKNDVPAAINSVSKMVSEVDNVQIKLKDAEYEILIKDKTTKGIIDAASHIVEFYIKKIYMLENHILMQNVLLRCIDFWLKNSLPVPVLESVLLKNLDKYFYPLSILLFCKNIGNNLDEISKDENVIKPTSSSGFLKEFSTKFCLQLCSMVLENVNKS